MVTLQNQVNGYRFLEYNHPNEDKSDHFLEYLKGGGGVYYNKPKNKFKRKYHDWKEAQKDVWKKVHSILKINSIKKRFFTKR